MRTENTPSSGSSEETEEYRVTEGISGTYYYHLSQDAEALNSICGSRVMPTNVSLASWGYRSHLNERYCEKCREQIRQKIRSALDRQKAGTATRKDLDFLAGLPHEMLCNP